MKTWQFKRLGQVPWWKLGKQASCVIQPSPASYHPHAFGHLLPSCAIFQFIHLSSILQFLSITVHLSSATTSNYLSYHLSPSLLPPSFNPITSFVRPPHACHILTGGTIFLGDLVLSILPCHWHLVLGYPHANPMSIHSIATRSSTIYQLTYHPP